MAIQKLHAFLDQIVEALFEPEVRRLDSRVIELDRMNREIKGYTAPGFRHAGDVFVPMGMKQPPILPSLAFQLSREAASFITDQKQVEDDRDLIRQILYLVTKDCETVQGIRDALPESIVDLSDQLKKLDRTNVDGYTVQHDERMSRQYQMMRDRIDVYWAARMLY